ncbi:MAG: M28 family metallopeptidase [Gemmatimonadota bacterium]|nr:M28 family metallopeptidase [Gemmatimonadota bacterium]
MARPVSAALYWVAVATALLLLLGVVFVRERPPAVVPATAPASEFSAARAWPVLTYLTDTIGYRTAGSAGADSAVSYLVRRLRTIAGIEVEVQSLDGAMALMTRPTAYSVRNVVARLRGRSREALLVSCHYDSPVGSVGAADDGVAVASVIEMLRALAAGPRPERTVIVNINDAEEQGLIGAHAFTRHPWIRDVRAFINLESAGTAGKAILFQTGPGNGWLTDAYARAAPFPYGSVIGQDIFQGGLIPSDTDFRIYRDYARLRGLDIAMYQGGYAYHTQRDRSWNVSPGSVQHMGSNALALVREMTGSPLPGNVGGGPSVYYDVLGFLMITYSRAAARLLAIVALLLGVAAVVGVMRRRGVSRREVALGFFGSAFALLAALGGAGLAGAIPFYVFGRSMGWYAHPLSGVVAFAALSLAAMLFVHRLLLGRRGGGEGGRSAATLGAMTGTLVVWMLVLLLLTLSGVGSAYLALWWVAGGAIALLAHALARQGRMRVAALVALLPAVVLTTQVGVLLLRLAVPLMGRLPLPIAPDVPIAILVSLFAWMLGQPVACGALRTGRQLRAAGVALTVGVIALAVTISQHPYTLTRPQRLVVRQEESEAFGSLPSRRRIVIASGDFNAPGRGTIAVVGATRSERGMPRGPLVIDAPPIDFPPPTLEVVASHQDAGGGTRFLELRARAPGSVRATLAWVDDRVVGWSLPLALPRAMGPGGERRLSYVAPPDSGWHITLEVRGAHPLALELGAIRDATTPALRNVLRNLPSWTDAGPLAVSGRRFEF